MSHALANKRIVITRPETRAGAFADALRALGATPILFPTIRLAPIHDNHFLDEALRRLPNFDWVVFTSASGVDFVLERLNALEMPFSTLAERKIAAIGPATANALTTQDISISLLPEKFVAESLFAALQAQGSLAGQRFLLLRAEAARPMLHEALKAAGAHVEEVHVYRTDRGDPDPAVFAELRAGVDVVTFTSPLTATYFCELLLDEADRVAEKAYAVSIGPITFHALGEIGLPFRQHLMAQEYTVPGLIDTLTRFYANSS